MKYTYQEFLNSFCPMCGRPVGAAQEDEMLVREKTCWATHLESEAAYHTLAAGMGWFGLPPVWDAERRIRAALKLELGVYHAATPFTIAYLAGVGEGELVDLPGWDGRFFRRMSSSLPVAPDVCAPDQATSQAVSPTPE
jgi:hypothetical protein